LLRGRAPRFWHLRHDPAVVLSAALRAVLGQSDAELDEQEARAIAVVNMETRLGEDW